MAKQRAILGALVLALAVPFVPGPVIAGGGGDKSAVGRSKHDEIDRKANSGARRRKMRARMRAQRRWHRPAPRSTRRRWLAEDPSPLVLRPASSRDQYIIEPDSEDGGFDQKDLREARLAFESDEGKTHRVHPRLLDILYAAQRRFRAPWVVVISGYRDDRATSRHSHGRAVDIVLPGVSDRRLAHWLTRQGFVGVGLYTRSGFVHLDVRHSSYFWMDHSWPGQRSRTRPVFRKRAAQMDARAKRRGEEPVTELASLSNVEDE